MEPNSACDSSSRSMEEDMKRMMADAIFSDIVLLCGDAQEEVLACRLLVAARSPVLEVMLLKTNMKESKQSRIPLPAIDGATMHICLEFFYTDTVREQSWLGAESAMRVISAAKFFLVSKLEHLSISYLHSYTDEKRGNETELIKAYSYGVSLIQAHPCSHLHALLWKLIDCVGFTEEPLHVKLYKHLSEQALLHVAQTLRERHHQEYDIFYAIIQWCASRILLLAENPEEEENYLTSVMYEYFPWSTTDLCNDVSMAKGDRQVILYANDAESRILKSLAEHLASISQKFCVDFSRMPTSILCSIIEPLKIVPKTMLMEAYRFQALSKPVTDLRWDEFGHNMSCKISEDDFTVISCESDEFQGFARCNFGFDIANNPSLQWEMTILTPCEFLGVGFYRSIPSATPDVCGTHVLGHHKGTCALMPNGSVHYNFANDLMVASYSAVVKFCKGVRFHCQNGWFDDLVEGLRVGVHLDMQSCSFFINGKQYGERWPIEWQSNEIIYPAISMQKPGRAQVKMVIEKAMINPPEVYYYKERKHKNKVLRRL